MCYSIDFAPFCDALDITPIVRRDRGSLGVGRRLLNAHARVLGKPFGAVRPSTDDFAVRLPHKTQSTFCALACQQLAPCHVNGVVYG
jgi:hypothetical protein